MSVGSHDQRFAAVSTDVEAFRRIRARLEFDVGNVITYYLSIIKPGDPVGFWAFARMLFPIAESLGDLIIRSESTANNLIYSFNNLYSHFDSKYASVSNILTLLYRHSLMHQDEMRMIYSPDNDCHIAWSITFNLPDRNLRTEVFQDKLIYLNLDMTKFYEDTLKICDWQQTIDHKGRVADRYNDWLYLRIPGEGRRPNTVERQAIEQLKELLKPSS